MTENTSDGVCVSAMTVNTPSTSTLHLGLLQPLSFPTRAWRDISMDCVEGLPLSDGCNVIVVVLDHFTKYAHFIPLQHPFAAPSVARHFVDLVVKLSDRVQIFTSMLLEAYFSESRHETELYHNRTMNQCLEMFLRYMVQDQPKQWHHCPPLAEFWYNSTLHSTIGSSPFKPLSGHEPNFGAIPGVDSEPSPVTDVLAERAAQMVLLNQESRSNTTTYES